MSIPSRPTTSISSQTTLPRPSTDPSTTSTADSQVPSAQSASKLTEAIDEFLGNLENKFRGISDEVLMKLDDMAERCDRLEAELLIREGVVAERVISVGRGKSEEDEEEEEEEEEEDDDDE